MARRFAALVVASLLAGLCVVLGTAIPAEAHSPRPTQLPALSAKIQDYCTHARVAGLVVSARVPGSLPIAATTITTGRFIFQTLVPNSYILNVSAPGYEALSDIDIFHPGTALYIGPGPSGVPAGDTVISGLTARIYLMPVNPPPVCLGPRPLLVDGLYGKVTDANTGAKIAALSVSLVNTVAPGPGPTLRVVTGKFVAKKFPQGTWSLSVSAPGYSGFSGVTITQGPRYGSAVGFIALDTELAVLLPAVQ
jgi:hypothetical protein